MKELLKIGIARGISEKDIIPAFEAALNGGFIHLEVTMNTEGASSLISKAVKEFKNRAIIGAGTVTKMDELKSAIEAGAEFIVSPVAHRDIIQFCKQSKIPVYPGAFTPTEVLDAWDAGADMVKVFPVSCAGGPMYVRELKGPFPYIKILACGGVTPENFSEYIKNGIDGIAIGASLFNKEWIAQKQFEKITEMALRFS